MVKRIDDDHVIPSCSAHASHRRLFEKKNSTAIAEKMGGRQFYYVNKCLRVGLNNEDRKELAALKRSADEVKVKKRSNVIDLKTAKVIR